MYVCVGHIHFASLYNFDIRFSTVWYVFVFFSFYYLFIAGANQINNVYYCCCQLFTIIGLALQEYEKKKRKGRGGRGKEVDVCSTCNIVTHFYYNTV
jgi:hypothetical protein